MAVIDAAVEMRAAGWLNPGTPWPPPNAIQESVREELKAKLAVAVDAFCKYGMANLDRPRAGLRAPQTSHDAAEWAKQFALTDAGAVFRQIYYTWRRGVSRDPMWDDNGLTTDEVEEALDRTHQSISARVNALKDAGWIIDSGQRRKTRSGRDAIVWTPTRAAIEFVAEHGMPIPVEAPKTLVQLAKEGEL